MSLGILIFTAAVLLNLTTLLISEKPKIVSAETKAGKLLAGMLALFVVNNSHPIGGKFSINAAYLIIRLLPGFINILYPKLNLFSAIEELLLSCNTI